MQLQLVFPERRISVRLFQNPTVRKWFDHFQQIAQDPDYYYVTLWQLGETPYDAEAWHKIHQGLEYLQDLGYRVPFEIDDPWDGTQKTLNTLHRFFTSNASWYKENSIRPCLNPFDPEFRLDPSMSFQQWLDIIDMINVGVHDLEQSTTYMPANKKFILENMPLQAAYWRPDKQSSDVSPWLDFDDEDQKLNYTYFDHDLPLVILDASILGKCVLQSFYEDDNPNAQDCTGRLGSFGGFFIDLNDNRKKIYRSQPFRAWMEKHERTESSLPFELPIGYVEDFEKHQSWLLDHLQTFQRAVFLD